MAPSLVVSAELQARFLETDYIVDDDPPLILKVGQQNDALRALFASFGVESGAFLTAWNPHGEAADIDQNYDRQADLLAEIEALRLNYFVGEGIHPSGNWREDSYLVLGIRQHEAASLAVKFKQAAYLWLPISGVPELELTGL